MYSIFVLIHKIFTKFTSKYHKFDRYYVDAKFDNINAFTADTARLPMSATAAKTPLIWGHNDFFSARVLMSLIWNSALTF